MRRRGRRDAAGIDITPLIDVLFMLIIFFVLTTAFVQGSIVIDLPTGDPPPISEKNPIVLTVTKEGNFLWAGEPGSRDRLAALAVEARARSEDVLVAGDRDARYGDVAELLDELRRAGVDGVGIAFEGGEP
jgi:biopolymer transport protein ExbD